MNKKEETKKNPKAKTWLELSEEDLKKLSSKTACMYGKKDRDVIVG